MEWVFTVQHLVEVAGPRVDLWEAEEPEDLQDERRVVRQLRDT